MKLKLYGFQYIAEGNKSETWRSKTFVYQVKNGVRDKIQKIMKLRANNAQVIEGLKYISRTKDYDLSSCSV